MNNHRSLNLGFLVALDGVCAAVARLFVIRVLEPTPEPKIIKLMVLAMELTSKYYILRRLFWKIVRKEMEGCRQQADACTAQQAAARVANLCNVNMVLAEPISNVPYFPASPPTMVADTKRCDQA